MLIPIGLDQTEVRRLPWVSIAIIGLNLVAFLVVGTSQGEVEQRASQRQAEVLEYWRQHPYLAFPERALPLGISPGKKGEILLMAEALKNTGGQPPEDATERDAQEQELRSRVDRYAAVLEQMPLLHWGLVPSNLRLASLLTSLFMHVGWLHLLGNMLFFYLSGPFIEDAFGRPLFAGLYLASGVVASFAHVLAFPTSDTPLVGASGAVAGIMGAFLVRFAKRKIRFFYWVFIVRAGTFSAPAWFVLPLWLLQQLFFAGLTKESGVAYWAHIGGFSFGAVVALVLKQYKVEERFIHPAIEKQISVTQHPALDQGMDQMLRGELEGAEASFRTVLAAEPRNRDALLSLWQLHQAAGTPTSGAPQLLALVEEEVKSGDIPLALGHWRELVAATGSGGPPALRLRLASALEAAQPVEAAEVLRHLAGDPDAGLVAEKATRRLAALDTPLAAAAASAGQAPSVERPPSPQFGSPQAGGVSTPAAQPFGPDRLPIPSVPSPEPGAPAELDIEPCDVEAMREEGLLLRGHGSAAELLLYREIGAVIVGGVKESPRSYLVLDLVLRGGGPTRRLCRLVSSTLDPRHLIERPELPPLEAFRELVKIIADASGVELTPAYVRPAGSPFPVYAGLAAYDAEVRRLLL
jgi:membrane associated rhomboid family serine protease